VAETVKREFPELLSDNLQKDFRAEEIASGEPVKELMVKEQLQNRFGCRFTT
jgi:hypothetical protein